MSARSSTFVTLAIGAVLVLGSVLAYRSQDGRSAPLFASRSMLDASTDEVNLYAIEYTQTNFVVQGEPTIRLSKPMTAQEATDVGLGVGNPIDMPRRYHTVILAGEFVKPASHLHDAEAYRFIAYVFDLEEGIPTTMIASGDGAPLKQVLDDPSIPDSPMPLYATPNPDVWDRFPNIPVTPEATSPTEEPASTAVGQ